VVFQHVEAEGGIFTVEYDEMTGWLTNGPVFESSDSLTNGWMPVTPDVLEQLDRFLDKSTFRAEFSTDATQQFFRVISE